MARSPKDELQARLRASKDQAVTDIFAAAEAEVAALNVRGMLFSGPALQRLAEVGRGQVRHLIEQLVQQHIEVLGRTGLESDTTGAATTIRQMASELGRDYGNHVGRLMAWFRDGQPLTADPMVDTMRSPAAGYRSAFEEIMRNAVDIECKRVEDLLQSAIFNAPRPAGWFKAWFTGHAGAIAATVVGAVIIAIVLAALGPTLTHISKLMGTPTP